MFTQVIKLFNILYPKKVVTTPTIQSAIQRDSTIKTNYKPFQCDPNDWIIKYYEDDQKDEEDEHQKDDRCRSFIIDMTAYDMECLMEEYITKLDREIIYIDQVICGSPENGLEKIAVIQDYFDPPHNTATWKIDLLPV